MNELLSDLIGVDGEYGHLDTPTVITLSPTVWKFVCSDADVAIAVGPRGCGKSTGAIARMIRVANEGIAAGTAPPMEVGAVRDTWVNVERTMSATLAEGLRRGWWDCHFYDQGRQALLNDGLIHLSFFGMDRPADANKFQGYQASIIWIDEPAPAADLASGVPSSVFSMGVSSLRQTGFKHSVQISMNPPDEAHWPLWCDTPVLTPTGWVKIGDLSAGDQVIAADGKATRVTAVFRRGVQRLYAVKFSDGASVLSTGDHPWGVETKWDRSGKQKRGRRAPFRIVTTDQIRQRLVLAPRRHLRHVKERQTRWTVPLVGAVQFPAQPVPLDPYVLGALLGDGGLTTGEVKLCSADPEIVKNVRAALPRGTYLRHLHPHHAKNKYDYVVLSDGGRGTPNPVNRTIKALGLMGCWALTKFIPEIYLWNTPDVRLSVLRGLLDTDGHASPDGNSASFASISERLIEGVEFLVRSLGGVTRRRTVGPVGPRRPHELRVLGVSLPEGIMPFRLSRKNARLTPKSKRHQARRYIVGCEPAGEGEAVCIAVAHPDKLFVCDQFVVTHNTLQIADALRERGDSALTVESFWVLPNENIANLPKGYREKMRAAFEADGRQDLVRRLVEGQIGSVLLGEAVTPGFSDLHIAKEPLPISMRWPMYRGWDLWMSPACAFVQVTPSGHVHVVGALQASGMGVEEFIQQHVLPWQTKYGILPPRPGSPDGFGRGPRGGFTIEDVIDPSGSTPDQSSSKRSARKIIEQLLRTSCSPGPVAISARVQSVNTLLGRMPGGRPMLQIDPVEGKPLIRALRGGWHRSRSPSGIIGPIIKNEASHIADGFGYLIAKLFPPGEVVARADALANSRPALPPPGTFWGV